jgi:hypothetical protein
MSLSVCLVTRNQVASLPMALGSVQGLAEEILVLDTGSTDGTVQLAQERGARLVTFKWDDDFAAARNEALQQARGDWILLVHPDEEVLPIARETLETYLAKDGIFAYGVRMLELHQADQPPPHVETYPLRLFRRHPDVRFVGRLHPTFEVPLEEIASFQGRRLEMSDLTLRHHAYLWTLTRGKLRWAVRLMEKELADRPEDLHCLIEYGRTLLQLEDPRGHDILANAASRVWALRQQPQAPTPTVGRLLEYLLTVAPEYCRFPTDRDEVADLALRWFPQTPVMLWRVAEWYFHKQDFARAGMALEHLQLCRQTGQYDRAVPFDPRIMGDLALLNLGICRIRTFQLDRAEQTLRQIPPESVHATRVQEYLTLIQRLRQAHD